MAADTNGRDGEATSIAEVPQHVAIIMDGNGRWARQQGKPRLAGHQAGTENIRRIVRALTRHGIGYVTLFAFSTENWGRPHHEVSGLLELLEHVIHVEVEELHRENVRIRHLGHRSRLPSSLARLHRPRTEADGAQHRPDSMRRLRLWGARGDPGRGPQACAGGNACRSGDGGAAPPPPLPAGCPRPGPDHPHCGRAAAQQFPHSGRPPIASSTPRLRCGPTSATPRWSKRWRPTVSGRGASGGSSPRCRCHPR